jgi:PAS domain S-box-containing protein
VAEENLQSAHGELNAAYEQLAAADEELRQNYQELAKSQQEIQKNEDRYRRIVEDQTEFICRFLPDGKLSFVNGAYCRYFSLDPATSIGRPHTVKIPREDQVLMKQHLAELSPEHPVAAIEHRIVMPDGEVRWQRWSDRAICDKEGRITEYQSVGQDITEQYEALEHLRSTNMELNAAYEQLAATEEELRQNYEELAKSQRDLHESEDRYRHIVEDQTEFISRFLPGGEHIFVNDAYCRYFGKSREEIVGHRFVPAIPGEDRPVLAAHFRAITPENPVHTIEHRIIMPDGEVRWQQWSDRAIFNGSGKVREYQSVGRDITDRKRTELALSEANKKLNLLTSITRHDILNQLTGLQGCLELIEAKSTDPVITMLVQRATRAGKVIDGQIVFTRQYENIGVKNPVWLEVSEVVKRVSQAGGFRMVRIDPSLEGLEIFTDPLLKLVFYNLFENAVVHGGTITKIEVGGIVTGDGTDIVVADDGKGILPSEKERIFEKGVGSHTGLGLYLVREILSITRMTISETGESGRGARFVIHVPAGMFRTSAQ